MLKGSLKMYAKMIAFLLILINSTQIFCQNIEPNKVATEYWLPSEVDKVVWAGRGDILLFQMNKLARVAIFDIKSEKIISYIPFDGSSDTLVVGTAESIILIAKDKKTMQRWTIEPLAKTMTVPMPPLINPTRQKVEIVSAAGGYASNSPFMILTCDGPQFYNSTTLKPIASEKMRAELFHTWLDSKPIVLSASADGSTFAGSNYYGIRTIRLDGANQIGKFDSANVGSAGLSADGMFLFASNGGIFSNDLKKIDYKDQNSYLPTLHPAYFLGILEENKNRQKEIILSLYNMGDRSVLLTINNLLGYGRYIYDSECLVLSRSDRIIGHPGMKKLIIIDETRTFLYIHPLDVIKGLEEKNEQYLFVESYPITTIPKNKKYEYAIKVASKSGNVKFRLDSGPQNMKISSEGIITWQVPVNYMEEKASVIVAIEDSSKRNIFHSYTILNNNIPKPPPPPPQPPRKK